MRTLYSALIFITLGGCASLSKLAQKSAQYLPQELFLLRLVLNQGDEIHYNVQSTTKNTLEFLGQTQSFDVRTDMDLGMRVEKVEEDGYTISFSIEKAQGTISTPQGLRPIPGIGDMVGKPIEVKISKHGEVLHLGGIDEVKGISDFVAQVAGLFLFIPTNPVKIGDVWSKISGNNGTRGDYTFTLKGVRSLPDKRIGIIEERGIVKVVEKQGLGIGEVDVDLSGKETSQISVDMSSGIPLEKKISLGLEGRGTISSEGLSENMDVKIYIDNTLTIRMK